MTGAQFKLDSFEGPLDLLLHLITKHKLNIYDIEIALLLEQYMDYINNLEHEDYEDSADFLEMASRLIYIKTCSLLPQDEEAVELKKELEGRIIEYSLCKKASEVLRQMYVGGDVFVRKPVKIPVNKLYTREHDAIILYEAYLGISEKTRGAKPLKAEMFQPIVSHKIVSVTSKIIFVLKKLYHGGEYDMSHLYDGMESKSEKVATFLAVLELTKSGRIFLNEDNTKIFFNKNSKQKKIESDFDSPHNEQILETGDSTNVNENLKNDELPLEKIEDTSDLDSDSYRVIARKSVGKPLNRSVCERVLACECVSKISLDEETDDLHMTSDRENLDIENAEDEIREDKSYEDSQGNFGDERFDEPISQEILEEIEILSKLSQDPPRTVFKPNYWQIAVYHWGNSPVGDDDIGNYWKFGYNRVRK